MSFQFQQSIKNNEIGKSSSIIKCCSKLQAPLRTTITEGNQGRRFYEYGIFQHPGRYNFFWWIDSEKCRSCKMIMPSFLSKLKECECEICEFQTIEIELLFELNTMKEMNSNLIAKMKSCNDCLDGLAKSVLS